LNGDRRTAERKAEIAATDAKREALFVEAEAEALKDWQGGMLV